MAVEEHGAGRQLVRFRFWPRQRPFVLALLALLAAGAADAWFSRASKAFALLATSTLLVAFQVVRQCGVAIAAIDRAGRLIGAKRSIEVTALVEPLPMGAHVEQAQ